jgi:formate hydrogenlyase transcriptional activator
MQGHILSIARISRKIVISQDATAALAFDVSSNPAAKALLSDPGRRHALILRAWEAITLERELSNVLAAVAEVIAPFVSVNAIGAIAFEPSHPSPYAYYCVRGRGQPLIPEEVNRVFDEAMKGPWGKHPFVGMDSKEAKEQLINYEQGISYSVPDILEKDLWFTYERRMAVAGLRSYCSIPLRVRAELIGVATFSRTEPIPFAAEELSALSDFSHPIGVAVANALANEKIDRLRQQLEEENVALHAQLGHTPWSEGIVGSSRCMLSVLEAVEQVAGIDTTVLLTGETGTGKELIARAIHRRSLRAHGPFVKLNCGAIPDTLLGSELFGHERGAFTGAIGRRKGRFEQAHDGTLFLDEIGELPLEMQVMLLGVLQEREFQRLGGSDVIKVNVRLVAATNRDLDAEVKNGSFRSDLFYRLNVFPIHLPPLRERLEDIPLLVAHLVSKHDERLRRQITRIDRQAVKTLQSYHWPGNVRELENVIERAIVMSSNGRLRIDSSLFTGGVPAQELHTQLSTQERELIESALRASRGRISGANGAARRLGLPASTLDFRLRKLGIDKYRFR